MVETKQTAADIAILKSKYIDYFREVPVQKYAAMAIGRDEDTIILWKNQDKAFSDGVEKARSDWVRKKASKVRAEFALERLEKEIWAERKEFKGDIGVNVAKEVLEAAGLLNSDGQADSDPSGASESKT